MTKLNIAEPPPVETPQAFREAVPVAYLRLHLASCQQEIAALNARVTPVEARSGVESS